jgi:predicted nucleotidyltransferase
MALQADKLRARLRQELPNLSARFGVTSLGMFGSFARNENRSESDLDLLVTFQSAPGLLTFIELENHLGDLLGVKVDLVMRESLKPHIGKRVLAELVPV